MTYFLQREKVMASHVQGNDEHTLGLYRTLILHSYLPGKPQIIVSIREKKHFCTPHGDQSAYF